MLSIRDAVQASFRQHQAGNLEQAEQQYRQILEVQPDQVDALHLLGLICQRTGRPHDAVEYIRRAVRIKPEYAEAHSNLGMILRQLGQLDEAVACYRHSLRLKPDNPAVLNNLGVALRELKRFDEAVHCYRQALQRTPNSAEVHNNIGIALADQGHYAEAATSYRHAIECQPDYAVAYTNLGTMLHTLKRSDEAIACYRTAVRLLPNSADAHINLGTAYIEQGKFAEAQASLLDARQLAPNKPETYYHLGNVYLRHEEFDSAVSSLNRALTLRPDFPEAYLSLADSYLVCGQLNEAVETLQRCIRLRPDYPDAHRNTSIISLLKGDFQQGWTEYEWRWRCKEQTPLSFSQPLWDGSSLQGRTILLQAEQGLGDTIQFIRYARLVKQRGGRVIVRCQRPLRQLLSACPGIDELIPFGSSPPSFDVYAPLMSLPRILGTTLETIPAEVPYLFPDPILCEKWKRELSDVAGFKIGVVWQGNPTFAVDRWRSFSLRHLEPLAKIPGVRLISLQKGAGSEQVQVLEGQFEVLDLASQLDEQAGPFMDTAAVMHNLDMVVSADTSTAHLAGALNVSIWLAENFAADWRWMLDREDSPWYPSLRLFRQKKLGDWPEVFARMARCLESSFRRGSPDPSDPADLRSPLPWLGSKTGHNAQEP